jgi:CBS domain-containing protein
MMLSDMMAAEVLSTSPDTSLVDAARAMTERTVGSAVVLEGGELAGIITERDILRATASGRDLNAESVSAWMTPDPVVVGPDEPPSEVARIMRERGFRHMPIVSAGALVGIVSLRDLWSFAFLPPEPDDL